MTLRRLLLLSSSIFLISGFVIAAPRVQDKPIVDKDQLPPSYDPSGKAMFKKNCASSHGADAKGHGPASPTLNTRVPDLTTLSKRHDGKFPFEYVSNTLRFGPGFSAHGSKDMPVWGPIFQYLDNYDEAAVRQRIRNLCDYLESLQQK